MAACVITAGVAAPDCTNRFTPPGVSNSGIWIFNREEITAYTSTVTGEISGITMVSLKVGFKLDMHKNTISWTEELSAGDTTAPFYTQTLTGRIISFDTTTRNAIEGLVDVDLVLVAQGKNNVFHVLGEDFGLKLTENSKTTGAISGDEVGDTLTFSGEQPGKARVFFDTDLTTTIATLDALL